MQLNLLTGTWSRDDTRLQRHIGAAIAWNLWHYVLATGDTDFLADYGAEMLLEIARFWASIARFEPSSGRYEIRGVIGPDEYHNAYPGAAAPGLDNNAYTNLMAVWTLCRGLEVLDRLPAGRRAELRGKLQLGADELALWDDISRRMRLVFHGDGIISQFAGFERLRDIDWRAIAARHPDERVDWALAAQGESIDAYQVTKQADVLMLFYLLPGEALPALAARLGYSLTADQMQRTARYYLDRISHESTLSRIVCAGALARLDPAASWRFFGDSLHPDAHPPSGSRSEEGLHLGAMAGSITVLQRHYLGIEPAADGLHLAPAPPPALGPVRMEFRYRGNDFAAEYDGTSLRLAAAASNGAAVRVRHGDAACALAPGKVLTVAAAQRPIGKAG